MEIRTPQPDEYAALGALTVAAYRSVQGWDLDDGYAAELADVNGRAAAAELFVALVDGELVGGITYVGDHTNPYAEDLRGGEAGIRMLAVDPSIHGQGVGRALMERCVEQARGEGRRSLVLHSTPWMTAAHRLYARLGFVRAPDRDWHPQPDVPLLGFILDLGSVGEPVPTRPASVDR